MRTGRAGKRTLINSLVEAIHRFDHDPESGFVIDKAAVRCGPLRYPTPEYVVVDSKGQLLELACNNKQ